MTISGKYELMRPVGVAGFRSFHARHVLNGQEVMLHFLEPAQRYQPAGGPMSGLDAHSQVLDAGISDGTQFLVTYPVSDFTLLRHWLDTVAPVETAAPAPTAAPPVIQPVNIAPATAPRGPAASGGAGEFTQMFGRDSGRPLAPTTSPGGGASIVAGFQDVSPRSSTSPGRDSGSFTARFGSLAAPAPAVASPPAAAAPPPAAPAPTGSGEFTQMFGRPPASTPPSHQAPLPPRPAAAAPAPMMPVARDNSESRMIFRVPPGAGLPPPPPPPPPSPASAGSAGEFTLMFQNPGGGGAPGAERQAGGMDRDFAREFLGDDRGGGLPPAPSELARPGAAPKPVTAAPAGEFTMMFDAGRNSPASTPPPRQAPDAWPPAVVAPSSPAAAAPPPASASGHSFFEGATQVFSAPSPYAAPRPIQGSPVGPGEFTMVMQGAGGGGGGSSAFPAASPPPLPAPEGGGVGGLMPGLSVQAPALHKPHVSMPSLSAPSVTGPAVSANGITPPSMQAPHLSAPAVSAPSISAPRLDARMPEMAAGRAGTGAGSGAIPPLVIALLSCLATVAVLAIVYVLLKK